MKFHNQMLYIDVILKKSQSRKRCRSGLAYLFNIECQNLDLYSHKIFGVPSKKKIKSTIGLYR